MSPAPGDAREEKLGYTDPEGRSVERRVEYGPDRPAAPGEPFRIRDVRDVEDGSVFVQKRLGVLDPRRRVGAEAGLETEIRVLLRLVRSFGAAGYPRELARIAGHDFDGVEPFLLLEAVPGPPAEEVVGRLLTEEQDAFRRALFRAVRYLETAGVVHGDLTPTSVRWHREQRRLCVTDFGHAALAGEPRSSLGVAQWAAPGPLRGPGPADSRDDVWSAGQVAYHVTTARPVRQGLAPVGVETQGVLLDLLQGVFAADPQGRPGPAELLRRLAEPDPYVPGHAQYDPLAEGRRGYAAALERKRQRMPLPGQPAPPRAAPEERPYPVLPPKPAEPPGAAPKPGRFRLFGKNQPG
ncbi:protein kinase domain-containing protein [Embleya sp. AB8]|uniref:protein kinase domain-containing protein n=1 Tax=Embleya sp. AB8 TaxID=3156304 RepID=UPI003C72FDEE